MALSKGALRELRIELANLQRQRSHIDNRIKGIDLVLSPEQGGRDGTDRHLHDKGNRATLSGSEKVTRPLNRVSLRRAVLELLPISSGYDVAEITKQLDKSGFQIGGKSRLRDRVSHELGRLRRSGAVRRLGKRKFVLTDVSAPVGKKERAPAAKVDVPVLTVDS